MIDQYTTITSAEASALWRLEDSTLRKAIADKRLPAQKSGGTWLVNTADMVRAYGPPKPDTSHPTRDETFFIKDDTEPLEDVGRVPGATGRHVLMSQDGRIFVIGGYFLRRFGETWDDWIPEYASR